MLACTNCSNPIDHDPSVGRLPPWCTHCGASLRLGAAPPATTATLPQPATEAPREEAAAPAVVPATTTFETMPTPAETPPRTQGMLLKGAIVMLGLTAVLGYLAATSAHGYARATGTVVQLLPGSGGETQPEIAYEVANDQYTTRGHESGLFVKAYTVGETVEVLYTPAHPENGHLYCPEDEWVWVELAGAVGAALLVSRMFLKKRATASIR